MKLHSSKLGHFDFPGGKLAYAYSGNTRLAFSAIQKCRKKLESGVKNEVLREVEKIHDAEYRRKVFRHPDYVRDRSAISYNFLIAIRLDGGQASLYVTAENVIHQVDTYECIGFGDYLAHYLIRPSFGPCMPQRKVLPLAVYALASVKDYAPNCGGILVYLNMQHDGRIGVLTSHHPGICHDLEAYSKAYDLGNQELLLALTSEDSEDKHFESYLTQFWVPRILQVRRRWTEGRKEREEAFARVNPHLTTDQVRKAFRELSMGVLPAPLESPGPSADPDGS